MKEDNYNYITNKYGMRIENSRINYELETLIRKENVNGVNNKNSMIEDNVQSYFTLSSLNNTKYLENKLFTINEKNEFKMKHLNKIFNIKNKMNKNINKEKNSSHLPFFNFHNIIMKNNKEEKEKEKNGKLQETTNKITTTTKHIDYNFSKNILKSPISSLSCGIYTKSRSSSRSRSNSSEMRNRGEKKEKEIKEEKETTTNFTFNSFLKNSNEVFSREVSAENKRKENEYVSKKRYMELYSPTKKLDFQLLNTKDKNKENNSNTALKDNEEENLGINLQLKLNEEEKSSSLPQINSLNSYLNNKTKIIKNTFQGNKNLNNPFIPTNTKLDSFITQDEENEKSKYFYYFINSFSFFFYYRLK